MFAVILLRVFDVWNQRIFDNLELSALIVPIYEFHKALARGLVTLGLVVPRHPRFRERNLLLLRKCGPLFNFGIGGWLGRIILKLKLLLRFF